MNHSCLTAFFIGFAVTASQAADRGRDTYQAVCISCHAPGNVMVSSPKQGDSAEWQRRLERAGNMSALVDNAIKGYEAMPPKGGRGDLDREQIEAAIRFMMARRADR